MERSETMEDRIAAARRLLDEGDLSGAARMAGEIRAERPAAGLRLLAGVALKRGDLAQARRRAEAAVAADPQDADALRALAFVEFSAGRRDAALELYGRAAKAAPQDVRAHLDHGRALAQAGRTEAALEAFGRAHALRPDAEVNAAMAAGLLGAGRAQEAAARAEEARALGLDSPELSLLLGQARLEAKDPAGALAAFRAVLAQAPDNRDALMGAAVAHARLGDAGPAGEMTRRYLELRPAAYAGPARGAEAQATVLNALYRGHFPAARYGEAIPLAENYPAYLLGERLRCRHLFLQLDRDFRPPPDAGEPGLVINNMVNPVALGEAGMARAKAALAAFGGPVINGLDGVARSSRARLFEALALQEGLIAPKLIEFRAGGGAGRRARALEAEFAYPYILRPATTQHGVGAALVSTRQEAEAALRRLAGQTVSAIAYHDCRDENGLSRVCRVGVIGDRFLPNWMHFADSWTTHENRVADPEAWRALGLDRKELAFLDAPESVLGRPLADLLGPVRAALGLDVFGIDFGIDREGRPVLFEANAAMNLMSTAHDTARPYRPAYRAAFRRALEDYLIARAREAAP
ncbi:MAG: tetratricopeptide repeat protein [Pseudomonadota bacterium]